jgi:hypothetical protein
MLKIHPQNNRIFEFRGESRLLVCATEHYGAVLNRRFRFERYLADAKEKNQTLTRLFVLFRELQSAINPYSTCKPESTDYLSPFRRLDWDADPDTKALDGEPKYDLAQWNDEFFNRLHGFLSLASEYGVIVEVVLFSNTYSPSVWELNPLNTCNNINDVEKIEWPDYLTTRHPNLLSWQKRHAAKIVTETNRYDNIFYEICNEPGGAAPGAAENPPVDEVDAWQREIARVIRQTEEGLPNTHLIAGQQAFCYEPWEQGADLAFDDYPVDIVNIHPLPNSTYRGASYDLGTFMSKGLHLRAFRDYCQATMAESKPLNMDEDNIASEYRDFDGWTIHRKRAWVALMCLCHYDYIDFTIYPYCETGNEDSQRGIRSWMKYLSEFIHGCDLASLRPAPDWLKEQPENTLGVVLAHEAVEYIIYLADEREITEPGAGEKIEGEVSFDLPAGTYTVSIFSPQTGLYSPGVVIEGGADRRFSLPGFYHDCVVAVRVRVNANLDRTIGD